MNVSETPHNARTSAIFNEEAWDKDTSKYKKRVVEIAKRPPYPGLFSPIPAKEDRLNGEIKDEEEAPQQTT